MGARESGNYFVFSLDAPKHPESCSIHNIDKQNQRRVVIVSQPVSIGIVELLKRQATE